MARHLICFTIDTDPDGITAQVMNRENLVWRGLERIRDLLDEMETLRKKWGALPITWFVRADAQIRDAFGSALHLVKKFEPLWTEARTLGHELGWHPHLYQSSRRGNGVDLITNPDHAAEQIEQLWCELAGSFLAEAASFRNGEGWHSPETFRAVERLGFRWDSTAIPGRTGTGKHPIDWTGTPNHPYFPAEDIRTPGTPRRLLEIPMNTWCVQAPYDPHPKLRYMNPAVHEPIFKRALEHLDPNASECMRVWTLVSHPDEMFIEGAPDLMYGRSPRVLCHNLDSFAAAIQDAGHSVEFATISQAGAAWLRAEAIH